MSSYGESQKIRFRGKSKDEFLGEVRRRVDNYFKETGKSPHATMTMHIKTVAFILLFVLLYCTLLFNWFPVVPRLVIWMAFGVSQALIATNIGHDALHGSYSKSPLLNRALGFFAYDCLGFSSYAWKQSHNQEHHTYTNIAGADPDISKPGVLRLSPHDPYNAAHRFQHFYVWLLYALVGTNWIFYGDYVCCWRERHKMPWREIVLFIFFKAVNLSVIYIAPFFLFPMTFWEVLGGLIAMQLIGGIGIAVVFQLAHVVEDVAFPLPDADGIISECWGPHEMATTSNFGTHNIFLTHTVGGLNFQVEHHLFPKISHGHYFEVSKIVRKTAKEYGLPYHEQPSLIAAIFSHGRVLKAFSKKSSDQYQKEVKREEYVAKKL